MSRPQSTTAAALGRRRLTWRAALTTPLRRGRKIAGAARQRRLALSLVAALAAASLLALGQGAPRGALPDGLADLLATGLRAAAAQMPAIAGTGGPGGQTGGSLGVGRLPSRLIPMSAADRRAPAADSPAGSVTADPSPGAGRGAPGRAPTASCGGFGHCAFPGTAPFSASCTLDARVCVSQGSGPMPGTLVCAGDSGTSALRVCSDPSSPPTGASPAGLPASLPSDIAGPAPGGTVGTSATVALDPDGARVRRQ
jgi:hypothetical protein